MVQQADTSVGGRKVIEDRAGAIRGTVVDDDQLETGFGLSQDALHRLRKERLSVVHWQDD